MKISSCSKGFSLVEVLIVIGLIAIATTIAAPAYTLYKERVSVKSAVREIAADFMYMKERAISENNLFRMEFDANNNKYDLKKWNSVNNAYELIQSKSLSTFGPGVKIDDVAFGVTNYAEFQPRGILTLPGHVTIGKENRSYQGKITVNFTGRTYVTYEF